MSEVRRRIQHNSVNAKLTTFAEQCGQHMEKEPSGFLDQTPSKRFDELIIQNGDGQMIYNVRGSDLLASTYICKT